MKSVQKTPRNVLLRRIIKKGRRQGESDRVLVETPDTRPLWGRTEGRGSNGRTGTTTYGGVVWTPHKRKTGRERRWRRLGRTYKGSKGGLGGQ